MTPAELATVRRLVEALENAQPRSPLLRAWDAHNNAIDIGRAMLAAPQAAPATWVVPESMLAAAPTQAAQEPAQAWKCFHCGETFADEGAAREHFGTSERQDPACHIDIAEYRRMEEAHRRQCAEDTEWHRAFYRLGGEHEQKMRQHGDAEYARGLRDGVNLPADSPERAALVAQAAQEPRADDEADTLTATYLLGVHAGKRAQEPRRPMTAEDVGSLVHAEMIEYSDGAYADHGSARDQLERFARTVEAFHGIKGDT